MSEDEILDGVIQAKATGQRGKAPIYAQYEPEGKGPITKEEALEGINKIRNSIVGLQNINWSEHIYPLVSLLDRARYEGLDYPENKENFGTLLSAHEEAIALLKDSPCMRGNSEWRLRAELFLKRIGRHDE